MTDTTEPTWYNRQLDKINALDAARWKADRKLVEDVPEETINDAVHDYHCWRIEQHLRGGVFAALSRQFVHGFLLACGAIAAGKLWGVL